MRLIGGVVGILVAAVLATQALALDLPPLPTVPTPTVPTPTVPTPTLPTPTVPAPLPPVPLPPVPSPPAGSTTVPGIPAPPPVRPRVPPVPVATSPSQAQPAHAPASTTTSSARHAPAQATPSARTPGSAALSTAATAPAGHAAATRRARGSLRIVAHFRSARAGRIRVFVRQLAPVCHRRRGFAFAARKGRNALRLPVRIRRHGRYELIGRARRHEIFRMRIGHGKSVCTALRTPTAVIPVAATIPAPTQPHEGTKGATHEQRNAASKTVDSSPSIASPLVRAVSLRDAPASIRPLLFVLLALSICFLGAAAMPQTMLPAGPVAAVVAQRRIYLAAAGIWLLAVVVFVTIVS